MVRLCQYLAPKNVKVKQLESCERENMDDVFLAGNHSFFSLMTHPRSMNYLAMLGKKSLPLN